MDDLDHPDNKLLVSVSANDWGNFCECPACSAVNAAEGSKSGTLIQFVNWIADQLEDDYPNVAVETLAYSSSMEPPQVTSVHPKVIVRFCPITSDFSRSLDDTTSPANVVFYDYLTQWNSICDNVYVWNYHANMNAYFAIFPDLHAISDNIDIFYNNSMKGYFGQISQTDGSDAYDIRNYVLARCMWNPENGDSALEEFCDLYYEQASDDVQDYITLAENSFLAQTVFPANQSVNGVEGWEYPGTSNTSATASTAVKKSGDQSLKFAYSSEAGNKYMTFDMAGQIGARAGEVLLDTWIYIDSISKPLLLQVHGTREGSSVANIAQVSFNTNNTISAVSGYSSTASSQSWTSCQWLHVVIEVDTDTDKYNVLINDTPIWTNPANLKSNYVISDIMHISLFKESYATGTVYLDDFQMGALNSSLSALKYETGFESPVRLSIRDCMDFTPALLEEADSTLDDAEDSVTPQTLKDRVREARLPVWFLMIEDAMNNGKVLWTAPLKWRFKTDPSNVGISQTWYDLSDYTSWDYINTNKSWTQQGYSYHGVAWYVCDVEITQDNAPQSNNIAFYFSAVDGEYCTVYLDGTQIGQKNQTSAMWNRGFTVSVNQSSLGVGTHKLVVRVNKNTSYDSAGIWRPVMLADMDSTLSTSLSEACTGFTNVSQQVGVTYMSEFYGTAGKQTDDFLLKTSMLSQNGVPSVSLANDQMKQYVGRIKNVKYTYEIETDSSSDIGYCVVQEPGSWSLNETIGSERIDSILKKAQIDGVQTFIIKARVKVDKTGNTGVAFDFGCRSLADNWGSSVDDSHQVMLSEVQDNTWQEFQFEAQLPYTAAEYGQKLYVLTPNNPDNIDSVSVDYLEITPQW